VDPWTNFSTGGSATGCPGPCPGDSDSLASVLDSLEDTATERYLREGDRVVVVGVHLDK